ncbi:unnamed protein product [Phytomonas sp. EM1]|nr:unnamed protein product [Phytomonas sp. EM1]|eukprot:CCW61676.1 unnamed protein product [Phytomonas sp. isolate EM1]
MQFHKVDTSICDCVGNINLYELAQVYSEKWLNKKVLERDGELKTVCAFCSAAEDEHTSEWSLGSHIVQSRSPVLCPKMIESTKSTPRLKSKSSKFSLMKLFTNRFNKKEKCTSVDGCEAPSGATLSVECVGLGKPSATADFAGPLVSIEEETPYATPRSGSLGGVSNALFMCTSCAMCCCLRHTELHMQHSGRGRLPGVTGEHKRSAPSDERSHQFGSHHCVFVAIPPQVGTRQNSRYVLDDVSDFPNVFPTAFIREFENGEANPRSSYEFYSNVKLQLDRAYMASMQGNGSSVSRDDFFLFPTRGDFPSPDAAMHEEKGEGLCGTLPLVNSASGGVHKLKGGGDSSSYPELPSPQFHYSSTSQWSLQVQCWRCASTPCELSGLVYNHEDHQHRVMRRLSQLMALLAYLRHCRVGLVFSDPFGSHQLSTSTSSKRAAFATAEKRLPVSLSKMQRARKSTEMLEYTTSYYNDLGETRARNGSGGEATHSVRNAHLSRDELEMLLVRAKISGFVNPGYFCYVNAVLQCVLRCVFLTRPLLRMSPSQSPGDLTTAMHNLIRHLDMQTSLDIRSGSAYHLVRRVYTEICKISSLFEQDEQQDAQEFLLCLLNGIADEFDKGRSAEEKRKSNRISFEGVTRTDVVCSSCHHTVSREEMFMLLSIPVKRSIAEGIKMALAPTRLRGKDLYACEYCFHLLQLEEKEAHNKLAREQKKRSLAPPSSSPFSSPSLPPFSPPLGRREVVESCVYREAEVRRSITRLGGTLAVHLLRFHYNSTARDFIKVNTPVEITMELDLHPYVGQEVAELYANQRRISRTQGLFPTRAACGLPARKSSGGRGGGGGGRTPPAASSTSTIPRTVHSPLSFSFSNLLEAGGGRGEGEEEGKGPKRLLSLTSAQFDAFGEGTRRTPTLVRRLVGILTHYGSLDVGHFIAYVRSLSVPDVWFCCDDDVVAVVDEETVRGCSSEVYMAFYE